MRRTDSSASPLQIETVNCAFIVRKDQEATNGIVHVVDSLLDPAFTVPRDLAELVLQVWSGYIKHIHLDGIPQYRTAMMPSISVHNIA
jgi:hypothetical protein